MTSARRSLDKIAGSPILDEKTLSWVHFVAFCVFSTQMFLVALAPFPKKTYTIFVQLLGSEQEFEISLQRLVVSYFAIVSGHHLIVQQRIAFEQYLKGMENECNVFRWSEYSISSSLIIVALGLLCGISDFRMLFALFVNMATVILCGYWAEKETSNWFPHFGGWILFFHLWGHLLLRYFELLGNRVLDSHLVFLMIPVMFILFCLFGVVQLLHMFRVGPWRSYLVVELSYILLSLITKTTMGFMVLSRVLHLSRIEKAS